jgi:hypothetical protein
MALPSRHSFSSSASRASSAILQNRAATIAIVATMKTWCSISCAKLLDKLPLQLLEQSSGCSAFFLGQCTHESAPYSRGVAEARPSLRSLRCVALWARLPSRPLPASSLRRWADDSQPMLNATAPSLIEP